MSVTATVFNITRGSFHDGPGVRSVVYLKGCSLACTWCHNPEGQRPEPQLSYSQTKCIGCGSCIQACPHGCIAADGGQLAIRFDACRGCGACARACPAGALTLLGERQTPEQVLAVLEKDRPYYERSGGGVTFSGGECLLHPDFMEEMLRLCREQGIHTLLESAFYVPEAVIRRLVPLADMVYVDIKHMDSQTHRRYTKHGNERILENIRLAARLHEAVTVRVPLIPGVNDSRENLLATVRFAKSAGISAMELLRYNYLAESKYTAIGRTMIQYADASQPFDVMDDLCGMLNQAVGADSFVTYKK